MNNSQYSVSKMYNFKQFFARIKSIIEVKIPLHRPVAILQQRKKNRAIIPNKLQIQSQCPKSSLFCYLRWSSSIMIYSKLWKQNFLFKYICNVEFWRLSENSCFKVFRWLVFLKFRFLIFDEKFFLRESSLQLLPHSTYRVLSGIFVKQDKEAFASITVILNENVPEARKLRLKQTQNVPVML